ncbi:hypothetical protein [uncultured Aeromicrobium sp.]|uniref:hypothetical protein n=1 Tax=uncultured Aeromicrobium sp. TaxID=337820 RepID=UPI0025D6D46B|nr:hypothetical protein [uncultured Aeromicrobium sp.]
MTWLHFVYWGGIVIGVLMFGTSWLIRRREITDGPLARAEKPLMLVGAGLVLVCATLGFSFW